MSGEPWVTHVGNPSSLGGPGQKLVVASQTYPAELALLPLSHRPVFPKTAAPILITEPAQKTLIRNAVQAQNKFVGLVWEPLAAEGEPGDGAPHGKRSRKPKRKGKARKNKVGVVAQILKVQAGDEDDSPLEVLVGGLDRFEVMRVITTEPYVLAEVFYLFEKRLQLTDNVRAYALAVVNTLKELVQRDPLFKQELDLLIQQGSIQEPGRLADFAAYLTTASGEALQEILETVDVPERLERVLPLLQREVEISTLQGTIRQQIDARISKQQREFYLREQLKEIRKELGLDEDPRKMEVAELREQLLEAEPPEQVVERFDEQARKYLTLEPRSPESPMTRQYIDWLAVMPWSRESPTKPALRRAREVLDDTHHGLDDVKERILEYVAAGILRGSFAGSNLLLVGPPGVGKTSIGRAIAEALGREFFRMSLGGMRDEAEIRGHRRTYIGAMPGKFVQALKRCKTSDPVIVLDEIDKVGQSYRGDPASALLEALDPEQNHAFRDLYLDLDVDLSRVIFVCTANRRDTIPPALLDRMEVINLSGYLLEEKVAIGQRFLLPQAFSDHGIKKKDLSVQKGAITAIARDYAREPGVRTLEKLIRKVVRKSALALVQRRRRGRITVTPSDLQEYLGPPRFRDDKLRRSASGVTVGLAWTALGGELLYVEAAAIRSTKARLVKTGKLGEVMAESSEIAYTLARKRVAEMDSAFFDEHQVHLHVPAGATPKDGPSAGVTMVTALVTLATGRRVRPRLAMTGEVNLAGMVTAVGGIEQKVLAAKRHGVRTVVLPEANRVDVAALSAKTRRGIDIWYVAHVDELLSRVLLGKGR